MPRHLELRESQQLYQAGIDDTQLTGEPIVLEKDGEPVAAVISYSDFQAFQKWQAQKSAYHPSTEFWADRDAFQQLLPNLRKTHKGKFVAIYRGELVDSADSVHELAGRVYGQFGYTEIYMDQVAEPHIYRIPSAWVVRK